MLHRIQIGIYLTRLALARHGTESFWHTVSWWHEETHYTIPQIEEEKRVAEELKAAFEDVDKVNIGDWLNTGGVPGVRIWSAGKTLTYGMPLTTSRLSPPTTTTSLDVINNVFVVSPPSGSKGYAGQWQWSGVAIKAGNRPSWVRRVTVSLLLGAEWVGYKGQKAKAKENPVPPEYIRWDEFLSET